MSESFVSFRKSSQTLKDDMRQNRILLFIFDATGLGHLRRMARIANELGAFAVLVVTGMDEAEWIVPSSCEVLRLPRLAGGRSLFKKGDRTWSGLSSAEAARIRRRALQAAFEDFRPDAVLVDYLPFGKCEELFDVLSGCRALKYFILRGIVDAADYGVLSGSATDAIASVYDRILVACDARIVDVAREYAFTAAAADKICYVGYVAPIPQARSLARTARGVHDSQKWVVCSVGGGRGAADLPRRCAELAAQLPTVLFDVVYGPHSELAEIPAGAPQNCRISRERRDLPDLHAAADVVVSGGGYNSIIEAAIGGARVLVWPSRAQDDEQYIQARRLGAYHPIRLLGSIDELSSALVCELAGDSGFPVLGNMIDCNGAHRIRDILISDLSASR